MLPYEELINATLAGVLFLLKREISKNGKICRQHDTMCEKINQIAESVARIEGHIQGYEAGRKE